MNALSIQKFNTRLIGRQLLFLLFILTVSWSLFAGAATVVLNPYADVDWDTVGQYKANMHTHTTQSDGRLVPQVVIDEYRARGYSILSLTDHNLCTWPWTALEVMERKGRAYQYDEAQRRQQHASGDGKKGKDGKQRSKEVMPVPAYENRDPAGLGMLAVPGNEASRHHHMCTYFIQYETESEELEQTLREVGKAGGLALLNHPGRYWKPGNGDTIPADVVEQYGSLYRTYEHLIGLEVINQGMRYPLDIALWDKVLAATMPERPVWGYANDDMHHPDTLGRDWDIFLLTGLDEQQLRAAMISGRAYFSSVSTHEEDECSVEETPVIVSIDHDETAGTLHIVATSGGSPLPDDHIKWISMSETVHIGSILDYKTTAGLGNYVRAELTGKGGTTFTNPFGLKAD